MAENRPCDGGKNPGWRNIMGLALILVLLSSGTLGCTAIPVTPQAVEPTAQPIPTLAPEPSETLPPGVTGIVFWEPFALDRSEGLLLGEMVRDFQAENPDVMVEIVPKSGYVGMNDAMQAALSGGDLPDLAIAFPSMIAEYAQAGVVVPLDQYVNDVEVGLSDEDLADIYPNNLEACRLAGMGGQLLAFPFVENAIGMWVNDTLLRQAGWDHAPATWQEFEQACFDVTASTSVGCYPFIESVTTFNAWLYSRGGSLLDEAGQHATFNQPSGVESLVLLRRLIDAGLAWRPEDPYGDYVAFANGQAAFTFSSTGNSLLYVDAYEAAVQNGMTPFAWHQAPIPQNDPGHPVTVLYGASFFILQGDPERQLAAWRLIRWFTGSSQTARWASTLETMPVRASALDVMTDTLATYSFFQDQVEDILPYARPEPSVAVELQVRDILYTAILSVTQGLADPQTALDQAAQQADAILPGP
jgi:multiple sugar transport system substrate-binding protein